jgi:predicted RNA binding protein YcfA (HicA-like mRNA interferase family)
VKKRYSENQGSGVKRQKLLKEITKRGAVFVRHGANHDIYENPRTNTSTQVPRHTDINELVARYVIKFFEL